MLINGYEIIDIPTSEEFLAFDKVRTYCQQLTAAHYLARRLSRPMSQEKFEQFVEIYSELESELGEENLGEAFSELFQEIPVYEPWDE